MMKWSHHRHVWARFLCINTNGIKNGTYSFTSTGAGTLATGTFSVKQTGVAQTENWTYQENFNVDTLGANVSGPNPSGMTLNSQYLNVFQINFRWLGAGEIRYAIEDSVTGNMVFFHREHYTNRNLLPHIAQPSAAYLCKASSPACP